jgi:RNA polymerase sigma factor (sigma-70 family)
MGGPRDTAKPLDPRLQRMALSIARAFVRRLPASVCREDLEQAALIGLMDGLRRHPDGEGPGYDWYLRQRIRGSIIDELRAADWCTRSARARGALHSMVHLDDVNESWTDQMAGASEDPELAAIRRVDGAKAWRAPLGARNERIMRAAYEGGLLQREIGAEEGVSEARVSQVIAIALGRMRSYLTGEALPVAIEP